jgi:hypothetical protein
MLPFVMCVRLPTYWPNELIFVHILYCSLYSFDDLINNARRKTIHFESTDVDRMQTMHNLVSSCNLFVGRLCLCRKYTRVKQIMVIFVVEDNKVNSTYSLRPKKNVEDSSKVKCIYTLNSV